MDWDGFKLKRLASELRDDLDGPEAERMIFAFEEAWKYGATQGGNPLSASLFELCGAGEPACSAGTIPALAVNVANVLYDEFKDRAGEIVSGTVRRRDAGIDCA